MKSERKHYLDNIRWLTVVIVVLYHVIYMYTELDYPGVVGKITNLDVQYYDVFQYAVYPWFMMLLFMVAGISSKLYLDGHTEKEFAKSRTTKLLVPSTIGLFAFGFLQGYVNTTLAGALGDLSNLPIIVRYLIFVVSGIGVLWFIQELWLNSMVLLLIRKIEKGKLLAACGKLSEGTAPAFVLLLFIPTFGAAQVLNTPIITVYRIGLYLFVFLLGYFFLSQEAVIAALKKWFVVFAVLALGLGIAFCKIYYGQSYADEPVNRTLLFLAFGYFASMAILGGMARYGDFSNSFTAWMSKRSFGLYLFHYLGISVVGLYLARPKLVSAPVAYLLSLIAGFAFGYILPAIISRIPFFRWAVLGIQKEKQDVQG
ncbi:MAG: acyltransferase [Lachnospiraceae bacterium]|jgi:peptidoglycan/LPS O-acetylase OafA/YrhL|nr:acyltransferase [Lachnospiraceae bacterium]